MHKHKREKWNYAVNRRERDKKKPATDDSENGVFMYTLYNAMFGCRRMYDLLWSAMRMHTEARPTHALQQQNAEYIAWCGG